MSLSNAINNPESPQEIMNIDEQLPLAKKILEEYDYRTLADKIGEAKTPTTGLPLESEDLENSGIGAETLQLVDVCTQRGELPILAGAYRMGKTSIGKAWVDKVRGRIWLDSSEHENIATSKEGTFIDEVSTTSKTVEAMVGLSEKGGPLVLSTDLAQATPLAKALNDKDIKTSIVILPLVSIDQLANYISTLLKLPKEDKLVQTITSLSGGCPFVSNIICQELIEGIEDITIDGDDEEFDTFGEKLIRKSQLRLRQHISAWDRLKNEIPENLVSYIPDPLLQYL